MGQTIITTLETLTNDDITVMVDELHEERKEIMEQECELVDNLYNERKEIVNYECRIHKLMKKIKEA